MICGNYRYECVFVSDALLPKYKGSIFRGGFGKALRSAVCKHLEGECSTCPTKNQCLYVAVFETNQKNDLPENSRIAASPHPFVIQPPAEMTTNYRSGDRFSFNLLLFGTCNHHLNNFKNAFEAMGRFGIGREVEGRRGGFTLERILVSDTIIFDNTNGHLSLPLFLPSLKIEQIGGIGFQTVRIKPMTPLRFKHQNHFQSDLPFHVLIRTLLRRISSLFTAYGDGEPELDYKGLVHRAQKVKTIENKLRWKDWQRYSYRQEEEMLFGGRMGYITYEGDLDEFLPLIQFGSRVHIGKQTAFGLGRYKAAFS